MIRISSLIAALAVIITLCALTSCNDPQNMQEDIITNEEALEVVEAYVVPANGGVVSDVENITRETESMTLVEFCDSTYLDTINYQFDRLNRQASSEIIWNMNVSCNNFSIPESATMSVATNVELSTARIVASGNSTFSGSLTGLELLSTEVTWNGSYIRTGNSDLTFKNANRTETDLNLALTNLVIDKSSLTIISGSGIYTLNTVVNGTAQTFSGTITFNGDQTATIVVNGQSFTIDLNP
ncbi:MAG: hypothetical protein AAFY71_06995 [Bacteroidota bacterium]